MAPRRTTTKTTTAPVRAIIYRRISLDRTGEEAGVTRQDKDCKVYCARKGWTVVANLEDNDISASKYARKKRPGYIEAIRMIEAGEADAMVAYHLDRLWRRPAELEHLIELVEQRHITVATLNGEINLMTGEGRLQARILVAVAANESDNMSRRIRRSKDEMALKGLPSASVRAFGWNHVEMENGVRSGPRGGMVIIPDQAEAIRDGARRFLTGEPLNAIARRWNELGFAGVQGGAGWNGSKVRDVLANPRNAGLRYSKGEYIGKAAWDPIIDEITWRRVVAKLADPGRRQAPKRVSLLTGLLVCGYEDCGHGLTRNFIRAGTPVYACRRRVGGAGCNRITITANPLEKWIEEELLHSFDQPHLERATKRRAAKPTDDVDPSETAALEADLALRLEMLDNGDITKAEYLTSSKRLRSRLESLRHRQAAVSRTSALEPYRDHRGLLRQKWPDMTLAEKRVILAAAFTIITIKPATRRGPGLDGDRVVPHWRV